VSPPCVCARCGCAALKAANASALASVCACVYASHTHVGGSGGAANAQPPEGFKVDLKIGSQNSCRGAGVNVSAVCLLVCVFVCWCSFEAASADIIPVRFAAGCVFAVMLACVCDAVCVAACVVVAVCVAAMCVFGWDVLGMADFLLCDCVDGDDGSEGTVTGDFDSSVCVCVFVTPACVFVAVCVCGCVCASCGVLEPINCVGACLPCNSFATFLVLVVCAIVVVCVFAALAALAV
jgi:hypothetical protein